MKVALKTLQSFALKLMRHPNENCHQRDARKPSQRKDRRPFEGAGTKGRTDHEGPVRTVENTDRTQSKNTANIRIGIPHQFPARPLLIVKE
jgi:hypothetical protein